MPRTWMQHIHNWDTDRICVHLQTDLNKGLSSGVAKKRLGINGKNRFTYALKVSTKPLFLRYLGVCFKDIGWASFCCSILCFVLHYEESKDLNEPDIHLEFLITGFLLLITFFYTGCIRWIEQIDDSELLMAFERLRPTYCTVVRDGHKVIIRSELLVLGDILLLTYGDCVPADVRFFEAQDLELNDVAFTDVSRPIIIRPELSHIQKFKAYNVGLAGTYVIRGSGKGIVIACGNDTEVGILIESCTDSRVQSRPQAHLRQITLYMYMLGAGIGLALIMGMITARHVDKVLLERNVAVAISLLPMSVPILIHFGLLHTRKKLLEMGIYLRNLEAGSTLGKTSVICTDIGGTLTLRDWEVTEIYTDGLLMKSKNINFANLGFSTLELLRYAVLCNDAHETAGQEGVPKYLRTLYGSSCDKAVLKFCCSILPNVDELRRKHKLLTYQSFNNVDKIHVTVHRVENLDGYMDYVLIMKGVYSVMLSNCISLTLGLERVLLDGGHRADIMAQGDNLLHTGCGIYIYAYKLLSPGERQHISSLTNSFRLNNTTEFREYLLEQQHGLHFLGMVAVNDVHIPGIERAVRLCREAGIKMVLQTHRNVQFSHTFAKAVGVIRPDSETVTEVAQRLGIPEERVMRSLISAGVINMRELQQQYPKRHHQLWDVMQILLSHPEVIFTHINVVQRRMLVEACQDLGAVITVIGNNLINTPIIQHANVGVAEGGSSESAHCCADIILFESNFTNLLDAIGQSRLLFENTKKALNYLLISNTPMLCVYVTFMGIGLPFRIYLINIMLYNFFVCLLPALSLYYAHADQELMQQKPRTYDDSLLNRRLIFITFVQLGIIETSAMFTAYFVYMAKSGFLPRTLMGLAQQWYDYSNNDLMDSYGQEWTSIARRQLELEAGSAAILTLTIMQCLNLILIQTGCVNFKSTLSNPGLIYLVLLTIFLISCNYFVCLPFYQLQSICFLWYVCPFAIILILLESVRIYFLRHFPDSWLEYQTRY